MHTHYIFKYTLIKYSNLHILTKKNVPPTQVTFNFMFQTLNSEFDYRLWCHWSLQCYQSDHLGDLLLHRLSLQKQCSVRDLWNTSQAPSNPFHAGEMSLSNASLSAAVDFSDRIQVIKQKKVGVRREDKKISDSYCHNMRGILTCP